MYWEMMSELQVECDCGPLNDCKSMEDVFNKDEIRAADDDSKKAELFTDQGFAKFGTDNLSLEQFTQALKWAMFVCDEAVFRDGPGAELIRPFAEMICMLVHAWTASVSKELKASTMNKVVTTIADKVVPVVAEKLFLFIDRDNSRGIQKEEVMALFNLFFSFKEGEGGPEQAMQYGADFVFAILDTNRNGFIEPEEVADFFVRITKLVAETAKAVMTVVKEAMGGSVVEATVSHMFVDMDSSGEGKLSKEALHFEEFAQNLPDASKFINLSADPVYREFVKVRDQVTGAGVSQWSKGEFQAMFKSIVHGRLDTAEELLLQSGDEMTLSGISGMNMPMNDPEAFVKYVKPQMDKLIALLKSDVFDGVINDFSDALFTLCDCDADGSLSVDELMAYGAMFKTYPEGEEGMAMANATADLLWSSVDTDGDGFIDKTEATVKATQAMDLYFAGMTMAIDIAACVLATWESTIFKEGVDGAKMMAKLDTNMEDIGPVDKATLIRVGTAMANQQQTQGPFGDVPYHPLAMWCVGTQIARGATEEDFREGRICK
jgi:Ca2+-binding EF-hand superfamily protein